MQNEDDNKFIKEMVDALLKLPSLSLNVKLPLIPMPKHNPEKVYYFNLKYKGSIV